MQFPLRFSFKILALAPQIYVYDSSDSEVFYVKQKLFKLKENIRVFRTSAQADEVAQIRADRIMDFSACYHFYDPDENILGAVRRKGWRSIWKAEYEVLGADEVAELIIREESAMVKVLDALLGQIPIIGFFIAMFVNPSYAVSDLDGNKLFRVVKKPAFFEGKFELHSVAETDEATTQRSIYAVMMMLLLERTRG